MSRAFSFLVNPISGGGAAPQAVVPVARLLRDAGSVVEVTYSPGPQQCAALVAAAVDRGDVVVSVGGDGMLSSVAGHVSDRGGTLGIVPAGRGNDFARMLGIPGDVESIARILLDSEPVKVDLIGFTLGDAPRRLVAGSVYTGVDAATAQLVDRVRWMPRRLQYPYAAVRSLASYTPVRARVVVDGDAHDVVAATVVVANSAYYGSGMKIAPPASVTDGFLDVVVVTAASRRAMIRAMPKVYDGSHVELDEVMLLRGRVVEISGTPSAPMGADGEPLGHLPPGGTTEGVARIEAMPGALTVLAP